MKKWIGWSVAVLMVLSAATVFAKASLTPVEPNKIQNKDAKKEFKEGMKAFKNEKYSEAATHFEAAAKADPNLAEAHINLGLALAEQGNTDEAKKHFDEATNIIAGKAGGKGGAPKGNVQTQPDSMQPGEPPR